MAKYLFGFKTDSSEEVGVLVYSGDGRDIDGQIASARGKGYTRLGLLTNPLMDTVEMTPTVIRASKPKQPVVTESSQPEATSQPEAPKKKRSTNKDNEEHA